MIIEQITVYILITLTLLSFEFEDLLLGVANGHGQ